MPAFDAASFGSAGGATTLTISHTVSGSNRVLLASCHGGDRTFTATYGGTAMTELYDGTPGSPFKHIAVYRLTAPATGTANIVFTASASASIAGCGVSYTDVDQTTPNDAIDVVTGTSTTPSNDVASETGDLVVDFVAANTDGAATPGASQTERVDHANGDEFVAIYASEEAGAATVTMSWTLGSSLAWTAAGLNLNAAAGGGGGGATHPGWFHSRGGWW